MKKNTETKERKQNKNMHTSMISYSSTTLESERPGTVIYLYSTICRMPCIYTQHFMNLKYWETM